MHLFSGISGRQFKRLNRRGNWFQNRSLRFLSRKDCHRGQSGYSLVEVVLAAAVIAMVYGAALMCYVQTGLRAEWSGYSLAAQMLNNEQIEQARSAVWDPNTGTVEITQLNLVQWTYVASNKTWSGYATNILDLPYTNTNSVPATNFVSLKLIYIQGNSNIPAYMIRCDTVWPFQYRKGIPCFTNTSATIFAPDNRSPGSME